ncbi:MAG: dTDP-glucose 4,6-dehydratase [Actinomycetes bacterium]
MQMLVTGAAGFLGSTFCRWLLETGEGEAVRDRMGVEHVVALDALTYAGDLRRLDGLQHRGLSVVHGDVCAAVLMRELGREAPDVVHFAAETHVDRAIPSGAAFARSNALGTQTLLDASVATQARMMIAVSTDEVYGATDTDVDELAPLRPSSAYAASKAAADLACFAAHHTHGLDVRVTRGANSYGPWQHPEKFVARFTANLLRGLPAPLYGDGHQRRCWLHAEDHARAVAAVLLHGRAGQAYNLPGQTELANVEVAARLVSLTGADPALVQPVVDRPGHDRSYRLAGDRVRGECGWAPTVGFDHGLAETVEWYRRHLDDIDRLERRS